MKAAITRPLRRAVAAAATLTGKRFGLLVASSVVATSAIVASALTGTGGSGALAALIGRSLASDNVPAATAPAPSQSLAAEPSATSPGSGTEPAPAPSPAPAPIASPSSPASEPAPQEPAEKPTAPAPEIGPVKHVFVISLASPGYEQSLGGQSQMPYLSGTLRPQGELLSNYTLLTDAGLPNQIAALSGQPPNAATSAGCPGFEELSAAKADSKGVVHGSGCVYPVETFTLADQLTTARLAWRAYVEEMVDETGQPDSCVHPNPGEPSAAATLGGYAASQNPFVYFHSLLDLGDCTANDLQIDQLTVDLRKTEKTPSFSFIAPTLCDAGAAGQCAPGVTEGAASADAFLANWVPKILASPAYKADGLLIVNFASVNPPNPEATAVPATESLRTGALLISPFLTPGATDAAPYNPYSILRSAEDLFGLDPLGLAAEAKTKSFAPSLKGETAGD